MPASLASLTISSYLSHVFWLYFGSKNCPLRGCSRSSQGNCCLTQVMPAAWIILMVRSFFHVSTSLFKKVLVPHGLTSALAIVRRAGGALDAHPKETALASAAAEARKVWR